MSKRLLFTIGDKKGVFTIIDQASQEYGHSVVCRCDCGEERVMKVNFFYSVLNSFPRCKCYYNKTAEYQSHPLYTVWKTMRTRCNWKNSPRYKDYGGRGIKVCKRWDSFPLFMEDVLPIWHPGLQLDRIDNDGDYCPENVQTLSPAENARKRPSSKITMAIADEIRNSNIMGSKLANMYGVSRDVIYAVRSGKTWVR